MDVANKGAIITGASRGLGAALARELAAKGARVVAVARGREELERVVGEIRRAGGVAHALVGDIADKSAIHPLAGAAAELVGPIDVLVNNASELGPTPLRPLLDTECEDLERVLAVNVLGAFRLSRVVAGSMALRRTGVVAFVSSDAALTPYPRWGAYSVSKAASDHLARVWATELGSLGVRVFAVDPGDMDTEMHARAIPDADRATLARPDDVAARITDMITRAGQIESGARLEAASWSASP